MNVLAVLTVFVFVKETVSSNPFGLDYDVPYAALGLIKNRQTTKLQLAIPVYSQEYEEYADYIRSDSEDENGPVEEYLIACPAQSNVHSEYSLETDWKNKYSVSDHSTLFIVDEWDSKYSRSRICSMNARPSIEKALMKDAKDTVENCGRGKGILYDVGFPVLKRDGDVKDVQFVPVYKLCYSAEENQGTLYTAHRIESPTLLLDDVWEYIEFDPDKIHKCSLDKNDDSEAKLYEKQYPFQFVGTNDMPTKVWASTTQFFFNYTPVPENEDLMAGMITVDNFIRLYSKETNKPLTVYSGVYETTIDKKILPFGPEAFSRAKTIKSFWRIIKDDDDYATIIITQYTKCFYESYLCHKGHTMVKEYKKGGCTYICSMTDEVREKLKLPSYIALAKLQLPSLSVVGDLDLTFSRKVPPNYTNENEIKQPAAIEEPPEKVSITEFFGEKITFKNTLEKADPFLASKVRIFAPSKEKGHGYSYRKSSGSSGGGGGNGHGIWSVLGLVGLSDSGGGGGGGDYGGSGGGGGE